MDHLGGTRTIELYGDDRIIDRVVERTYARTHNIGVRDAVKSVPIIDAEPVRHGAWTQEDTLKDYYFCSRCLAGAFRKPVFKYCPHCGAKMDAEED